MFKIKHFNDLSSNDMYEIAKSRYEVFACEQKITSENDFDDVDKECFHVFKEDNGNIIAYARIIPKAHSSYDDVSIGRVLVLPSYRGNRSVLPETVWFSRLIQVEDRLLFQKSQPA